MQSLLLHATHFATEKHRHQRRKGAAASPYINHPLAVAWILSSTGFKTINDSHGHAMGDQLLIARAQRLRASLHDIDTLARLGGTCFPRTDELDADQLPRQADQAMDQAKRSGRNRYCVST